MIALGVDPGLSGAIALVCARRGLLEVANLPTCDNGAGQDARIKRKVDAAKLRLLVYGWSTRHSMADEYVVGVIERMQPFGVGGTGHTGKASPGVLLSMGHSAGIVEGVLTPKCDRIVQVLPQQWKRTYGLTGAKADSRAVADRMFGDSRLRRHDLAEAALIAQWALGAINGLPAVEPVADPLEA